MINRCLLGQWADALHSLRPADEAAQLNQQTILSGWNEFHLQPAVLAAVE